MSNIEKSNKKYEVVTNADNRATGVKVDWKAVLELDNADFMELYELVCHRLVEGEAKQRMAKELTRRAVNVYKERALSIPTQSVVGEDGKSYRCVQIDGALHPL